MTPRERFLRAARGQDVDRPPVWLMRQAGRYLPEYREIRASMPFEARVQDAQVAAEITLQPMRRFALDAAVVFSDILVPLAGMGRPARFPGEGPVIDRPVRTPGDVADLRAFDPHQDAPFALDTIRRVREALPDHAVLGFAGAPFTLAAYLVEGGGSKGFAETKRLAYRHPDAWRDLLSRCAETAARHLVAQLEAGADAVQLFDTWAETLSPREYASLVLPHVRRVFDEVGPRRGPRIYFARGTPHLLPLLPQAGADAWSVDWRVDLAEVRRAHPGVPLQGNLDPTLLFAPPDVLEREVHAMMDQLGGRAHVANLGHGILPGTPLEGVAGFVKAVESWRN